MEEIIHVDLFSGVGGFAKGFEDAGINIVNHYYSEIDKHAIAVYKHKFKNSEYVGSVTDVSGTELREKHPEGKFIVTFGFPCQDLSIAGKGEGLSGKRSGLFFEAIRIIKELDPEVFIFENVKGLLSSNEGKDFEVVLRTIADLGLYECEWQLVNTAWVLPQNRERVYFVGHFGGRSKPRVFPFRKGDFEFSEKSGHTTEAKIASCLQSPGNACGNYKGMNIIEVGSLNSSQDGKVFDTDGLSQTLSAGHGNVPKIEVKAVSMERTEDGKKLRKEYERGNLKHGFNEHRKPTERNDGLSNTIDTNQKSQMIKIKSNTKSGYEEANPGDGVRFDHLIDNSTGRGRVQKGVSHTLDLSATQGVLIAKHEISDKQKRIEVDICPTLTCGNIGKNGDSQPYYKQNSQIRRLTEIECERLQGFPDNWTQYGNYDREVKEVAKTNRYKQMGNAVTTIWPKLIAERLYLNK